MDSWEAKSVLKFKTGGIYASKSREILATVIRFMTEYSKFELEPLLWDTKDLKKKKKNYPMDKDKSRRVDLGLSTSVLTWSDIMMIWLWWYDMI